MMKPSYPAPHWRNEGSFKGMAIQASRNPPWGEHAPRKDRIEVFAKGQKPGRRTFGEIFNHGRTMRIRGEVTWPREPMPKKGRRHHAN